MLLLSATPYKMYTIGREEEQDDHYRDFMRTTEFLFGRDANHATELRDEIQGFRVSLYRARTSGDTDQLLALTSALQRGSVTAATAGLVLGETVGPALAGVVWRSAELGWARVLVSCAGTDAGFPPAGLTPARFTPERGVGSEAVEGGRGLWSGGRPPVTVIAPSIDQGSGEGSTSRAARVVPIPREPLRVSRWALW